MQMSEGVRPFVFHDHIMALDKSVRGTAQNYLRVGGKGVARTELGPWGMIFAYNAWGVLASLELKYSLIDLPLFWG